MGNENAVVCRSLFFDLKKALKKILGGYMLRSIMSAFFALYLSLRFCRQLKIRWSEVPRYIKKSSNLGLCYGAFVRSRSLHGPMAAGKSAFCSCAYDVITDWRLFDENARIDFEYILQPLVPKWALEMTMSLYWKDKNKNLSDDGLERGVIAVEFITRLIGSRDHFTSFGIRRLGLLLQIVDDIIDLEGDKLKGEENCLLGSNAMSYIHFLQRDFGELQKLFGSDKVMAAAILKAYRKSERENFKRLLA